MGGYLFGQGCTFSMVNDKYDSYMGDVAFAAQCVKQPDIASSTNDAEVRSLFHATKRTLSYKSIFRSIGNPQQYSTVTHEDNAATIAQVIKDRLTP